MDQVERRINVFPNPTTGKLIIQVLGAFGQAIQAEITDMLGREVMRMVFRANRTHEVDISHLANQVYLIKVCAGERGLSQKLVKH
jgi:hypothetical protein